MKYMNKNKHKNKPSKNKFFLFWTKYQERQKNWNKNYYKCVQ